MATITKTSTRELILHSSELLVSSDRTVADDASRELANLDLLRTVAVALVFFSHLFMTLKIRFMGELGHLGVLLFFVHTSFVLMMSMERLGLRGPRLFWVFMIRRAFRIYPL